MTSEIDTEIRQISPKFSRNPQFDFTFCLPTLGRHPTFRTLLQGIAFIFGKKNQLGAK